MEGNNIKIFVKDIESRYIACALSVLVVVINAVEIHILRKTMDKAIYEKILLSLSTCDMIGGLLGILTFILAFLLQTEMHYIVLLIAISFGMVYSSMVSFLHLICISTDRLWAVAAPFHHRSYASTKKLYVALLVSYCLPIIMLTGQVISIAARRVSVKEIYTIELQVITSGNAKTILIADTVLIVSYCSIMCILCKRGNTLSSTRGYSMGTFVLCMSIVLVFIISSTPFVVANLTMWEEPTWLYKISMFALPTNQITNSLVFLVKRYNSEEPASLPNSHANKGKRTKEGHNICDTTM